LISNSLVPKAVNAALWLADCLARIKMNQVLIRFALAGIFAGIGICRDMTDTTGAPADPNTRHPLIARFLKDKGAEDLRPFTAQERLRYYLNRSAGAGSTFSAAAAAGYQQLVGTPKEWNNGADGYRKRFSDAYGAHLVQGAIEYGASALLNEDNRYRPSLETGWWRRSKHAILGALCSTDSAGRRRLSYSRMGTAGATAFVRRTWQPASRGGAGQAVGGFALTVTAQMGTNLVREFKSDLQGRFLKGR
jgi:hypothetical protein